MLAATAVKDWLAETGTPGRVRYYGCPAEEGGAAKAFMVRAGAFEDVDIAITWHPNAFNEVDDALVAGQHAHRLRVPRARLPRRRRAASGPLRAGRGGADECRRELHARAHAVATRASTTR